MLMGLNGSDGNTEVDEVRNFNTIQEASEYILELTRIACIDGALVSEENWVLFACKYSKNTPILSHPFYKEERLRLENRGINFGENIERKIEERKQKVFKNGLHRNQKEEPITVEVIEPHNDQIHKVQSKEVEWSMGFKITQHLTPRYIKDGDKGEYTLYFEIYVKDAINSSVLSNNAVLNTGNRQYVLGVVSPKRTPPETSERDASIQRSAEAYRKRLVNVLRLERKTWQTK